MSVIVFVLSGAFAMCVPFALAALGELVAEKSGVLNLSVEGMMALSAVMGFMVVAGTGSHVLGLGAGMIAGAGLSVIFAALVLLFRANQVAAGLAVGILGMGLSNLLGRSYEGSSVTALAKIRVPVLSEIPVIGPILFVQDIVVYLTVVLVIVIAWFLYHTKPGLRLRVIGENPETAYALGMHPVAVRLACVAFGGMMAGLAGAYASTILTPVWAQNMIAGRGWVAVALVVFGTWRPIRIALGAYLFGAVGLASLSLQSLGVGVPSQVMSASPYLLTIIVLVVISANSLRIRLNAPMALGQNFSPHG
ncbi:ABC transporter permease [Devosia limi DSM 17137]|uniref:ABC transporter permease n=1 Tax=Devosia limi DSM 17137 TaxID=1121477 RepID=A0A0F5LWU3_9HYPH|nr:ABC transporter permease [Devosia limi]KKB86102.1 ABC transporter permease [Devosia limi DSM 17137]SHF85250.1 simple sugar transport system permease protein [Devosia limi DSM 17137]